MLWSILIIAVALHIIGGIVATVVIVARYIFPEPAVFEMRKEVRIPAKEREHKMNMESLASLSPKPSFNDKMLSERPAPFSLPDLPKISSDQLTPVDPSTIVGDAAALVGTAGVGAGGGVNSGFSFLGMQSSGQRILFLFDVSSSVANKALKAGMPLSLIKEETLNFIKKLPSSARFGIIQFTQNYKVFNNELVPANDKNRESVTDWIENEWVEKGTMPASRKVISNSRGLLGVLERAAEMDPDVIFIVSDASFQYRPDGKNKNIPWTELSAACRKLAKKEGAKVPINFIGFQVKPADKTEMRRITGGTGGKFHEINK